MADVDPAFKVVTRGQTCFNIWRIENMQVVAVPKEQYGNFYSGDSYIVLSACGIGESKSCDIKAKESKSSLEMDIHFWLGSETSQDEAGVAAYKSVELDDYLGGTPVQHREVERQESTQFLNYFKSRGGIKYLKGGVASGFNHVEHTFSERLMQVKGKHHVRIKEVDISWSSMNSGDVFLLDLGRVIFLWHGKESSYTEKLKAGSVAQNYRDERGKCDIIMVAQGEELKMSTEEKKMFGHYLSLSDNYQTLVKSAKEGGEDEVVDRRSASLLKLYVLSDDDGMLKVTEKKSGPLSKDDLKSEDCCLVDNGEGGVWVWTGKGSNPREKKEATRNALGFINKKGYASHTPITRVMEGYEPAGFKCLFKTWSSPLSMNKGYSRNKIAKTVQTKFDASTLHSNRALAAETQMVDDGTGKIQIWRIENFEMVPLPTKYHSQFFGGDCYVILYTYLLNNKENYIIYYWQGLQCSIDERGASAYHAVQLDDSLGGAAIQVRVVQGKEPLHFMAMFGGKMVIFRGGKAGWTKGDKDEGPGDSYMLQVRGTTKLNNAACAKAVQVVMRASSLNSNDVFVIFGPTYLYIWYGKGSTGDEREMANVIATRSNREPVKVIEGQEKNDFWNILGGKEAYANDKRLQEEENNHPIRLFQCSNASGKFTVEEIPDFNQIDLVPEDVMLLDARDTIFLWIGSDSNKDERNAAQNTAIEYLKTDPSGRDEDTPIVIVKQGFEPPNFTGFFGAWDFNLWSKGKTYEELKQELGEGNVGVTLVSDTSDSTDGRGFSEVTKYSLEELVACDSEHPLPGVDPSTKETHLTEEDFERIFLMKYAEFVTIPVWKQVQLKKKHGLF